MIISIQYLRAIACICVILLHITTKTLTNGLSSSYFYLGASGVDLFFIISGFIITYISGKDDKFFGFIINRFIRVYPIYWICLIPYLAIYLYRPDLVNTHASEATSLLKSLTLYPFDGRLLNMAVWTLTYELYFYLIFSLSLLIKGNKVLITAALISLLFILGNAFNIKIINSPIVFEFVAGMFVYELIYKRKIELEKMTGFILFFLGLIFLVFASEKEIWGVGYDRLFLWGGPMLVIFSSLIMIESKLKRFTPALHIGNASYITYLVHILVINAVYFALVHIKVYNVFIISLMGVALAVVTGYVLHHYFEKPIVNYIRKLSKGIN